MYLYFSGESPLDLVFDGCFFIWVAFLESRLGSKRPIWIEARLRRTSDGTLNWFLSPSAVVLNGRRQSSDDESEYVDSDSFIRSRTPVKNVARYSGSLLVGFLSDITLTSRQFLQFGAFQNATSAHFCKNIYYFTSQLIFQRKQINGLLSVAGTRLWDNQNMKKPKDLAVNAVGATHGTLHNSSRTLRERLGTVGGPPLKRQKSVRWQSGNYFYGKVLMFVYQVPRLVYMFR